MRVYDVNLTTTSRLHQFLLQDHQYEVDVDKDYYYFYYYSLLTLMDHAYTVYHLVHLLLHSCQSPQATIPSYRLFWTAGLVFQVHSSFPEFYSKNQSFLYLSLLVFVTSFKSLCRLLLADNLISPADRHLVGQSFLLNSLSVSIKGQIIFLMAVVIS